MYIIMYYAYVFNKKISFFHNRGFMKNLHFLHYTYEYINYIMYNIIVGMNIW